MGQAMVFEFGGYGPSSILRHLYLFSLRGGQRAAAAAIAAVEAAMHACFAASCLHAVHVLCAMCARMRPWGVVGAYRAPQGVGSARGRPRHASLPQLYAPLLAARRATCGSGSHSSGGGSHACMLCCLMLACCACAVRHVRQDGGRVRPWGVVGAYRAPQGVGSARGRPRHASLPQLYACACQCYVGFLTNDHY